MGIGTNNYRLRPSEQWLSRIPPLTPANCLKGVVFAALYLAIAVVYVAIAASWICLAAVIVIGLT
jgi:hypothetical protein